MLLSPKQREKKQIIFRTVSASGLRRDKIECAENNFSLFPRLHHTDSPTTIPLKEDIHRHTLPRHESRPAAINVYLLQTLSV